MTAYKTWIDKATGLTMREVIPLSEVFPLPPDGKGWPTVGYSEYEKPTRWPLVTAMQVQIDKLLQPLMDQVRSAFRWRYLLTYYHKMVQIGDREGAPFVAHNAAMLLLAMETCDER